MREVCVNSSKIREEQSSVWKSGGVFLLSHANGTQLLTEMSPALPLAWLMEYPSARTVGGSGRTRTACKTLCGHLDSMFSDVEIN